jgi:nuclear GTP-binding protein
LRDKPRSVDDMSRNNKDPRLAAGGMRDRATVKRLLMYREKAPIHRLRPESAMKQAKVAPNRQWFGNTRVIGQKELANFREELQNKINDPYTVLLKGKKLPLSLLQDTAKARPVKMLDVESFEETFSKKRKQKRPKIGGASDLSDLLKKVDEKMEHYDEKKDTNVTATIEYSEAARENIFTKGQSKRIWAELHKVIDSSDVLVQVLDVRDPMGTRCPYVEVSVSAYIRACQHNT